MMPGHVTQTPRDYLKQRFLMPKSESTQENVSIVNEKKNGYKLRHRRRQVVLSIYDNYFPNEEEVPASKWDIVRQRLPDILALSDTYKPTRFQTQMSLLVGLVNRQNNDLTRESSEQNMNRYCDTISHIVPSSVVIDVSGRNQLISLKRIPSEQVIHVDINGIFLSVPTRQFILAVSHGYTNKTAVRYCPPAIREMLIDLSKSKVLSDRLQYERAQLKMLVGKILFYIIFVTIILMVLALMIGVIDTIFRMNSFNKTLPHIPIEQLLISDTDELFPLPIKTKHDD